MSLKLKKILIIEDERPLANALELKLNHVGFDAKAVYDGDQGIEIVKKEEFDLILLDLLMPKKDGFGFLADLKELGIKIPVIVSSNLSQEEDFRRAKELGAVDYFVKSNTAISEIVEYVRKALNMKV